MMDIDLCTFGCLPDSGVPLSPDLPVGAFVVCSFATLPVLRNAAATCAFARLEDIFNVVHTYKIRECVIFPKQTTYIYLIAFCTTQITWHFNHADITMGTMSYNPQYCTIHKNLVVLGLKTPIT
jgi:hypothetical protein